MPALLPADAAPPIVITGEALSEERFNRVLGTVRIERERIARSPSHRLDQLLKEVPGLQLYRRSDSSSGHPTSQGVTLRALGGNASSRALLILDGVPQSDPFGGWINWPAFDPANLERIDVVRGGGSVAHGPGALAGTIVMTSRSDPGFSGTVSGRSRGSIEVGGADRVSVGGGVLGLSGRMSRGDGFVPVTADTRGAADRAAPYREWNGRGRWVAPVGGPVELELTGAIFRDVRNRGLDFTRNRTDGADASARLVGRGRWQWSALGYWQMRDFRSEFASAGPGRTSANPAALQYSVPSHAVGGRFELRPPLGRRVALRIGVDGRRANGETREYFLFSGGDFARQRRAGGESWTLGGFADTTVDMGLATVTVGGRLDRWGIADGHLFERERKSGVILADQRDRARHGWLPTARLGIAAPLAERLEIRSAAYLGWRPPTLNELFRPFRAGSDATAANPALKPERLAGVEAGIDYRRGDLRFSLTGYANRLRDAIANVTLGQGPGFFPGVGFVGAGGTFFRRENIDAVKVRGVEAAAEWAHGPWSIRAAASLAHARISAVGVAEPLDGLRPAQTPAFSGSLAAGWARGDRAIQLIARRVGRQFDDDLNVGNLKAATTLDAFASWPISRFAAIIGRAENVANARVMAGINGDGSIERATPRTLWIGLRLELPH